MYVRKSASMATLAVAALVLSACGGSDEGGGEQEPLVFAAVPSEESEQLEASFAPLLAALEEDLGVPIEFEAVTSNAGVIEAQVAERVDIAVYGAFSYHLASTRAEIEPIAAPIQGPGMEPGAVTYGVVRSDDSSIQSLEDAAGKDLCFTDPGSTTGYLQPLAALLEAGVDPEADAQAVFTGGHDTSVASLLAGDCDLAFVGDVFIDRLLPARGLLDPADVTKVWTSPTIPAPPLVIGTWLPEETRAQIRETVTARTAAQMAEDGFCEGSEIEGPDSWGDQAGVAACTIDASNAWAFVPATAEDYEPIARICEITEAEVCTEGE